MATTIILFDLSPSTAEVTLTYDDPFMITQVTKQGSQYILDKFDATVATMIELGSGYVIGDRDLSNAFLFIEAAHALSSVSRVKCEIIDPPTAPADEDEPEGVVY